MPRLRSATRIISASSYLINRSVCRSCQAPSAEASHGPLNGPGGVTVREGKAIEIGQSAYRIPRHDRHDDCGFISGIIVANALRHVIDTVGIDAGVSAGEVALECP